MQRFLQCSFLVFLVASAASSAETSPSLLPQGAVSYLQEYDEAILVHLYKDRLPAIYETYVGIREKQKQVDAMRRRLGTMQNELSADGPREIIRKKIISLNAYKEELNKCILKLEECAYERILVHHAIELAPASISEDIRAHMDTDVEKELEFATEILKKIDPSNAD